MTDVKIIDVSPRDGLQNDSKLISVEEKVELINRLLKAKVNSIEVTSFVHPKKVPQMADAEKVVRESTKLGSFESIALVPNYKGFQRLKKFNLSEINWVSSATETFNQKNIGFTIEESLKQFKLIQQEAKQAGIKTNFSIAVSFGCPYEGDVDKSKVIDLVQRVKEIGADRITIADTIGIATPNQVKALSGEVLSIVGNTPVAIHLHDTRGLGLANAYSAYEAGIRIFETAVSGIGGCPFAPGAAGNLATEDLVYLFHRMNINTGLNLNELIDAADFAASLSSKNPLGRIRHIERNIIKEEIK